MDSKIVNGSHHEDISVESDKRYEGSAVNNVASIDVENYHGLQAETVLVYLSLSLIVFSQIVNLVGAGAFARDIAAVVGGSAETVWLSSSIGILTCILGPPVSQAADYWGRKWFIVILTLFGVVGCVIISRATSMGMVICGEVIASLAFGCQSLLYAVTSEIFPRRWRPLAQGGLNVSIAVAGIFSILVGFKLTSNNSDGFRVYFYICAGIQGLAAVICAFLYNPPPRPLQRSLTLKEKIDRLDWIGYFFLALGIVLLSMGLAWSQNPYPWTDAHTLATFLIGVLSLIVLALYQWKGRSDGMFNHELFKKDRNFSIALFCLFVEGVVFFAANNYFIFEMTVLYETDSFKAGERFIITFLSGIVASSATAIYSSATKKLRLPTVIAFISFVLFHILMATADLQSGTAMWAYPIFLGIGLGVCLTCLVTAAQLSAPPSLISISSGLLLSVRSLGGSIALAIYNAIYNSQIQKALPQDVAAAVLPLGLAPSNLTAFINALSSGKTETLSAIPGVTPEIIQAGVKALQEAYLVSFRYVWVTAGVFSAFAAIGALFIINPTNDLNMHVDAPLED